MVIMKLDTCLCEFYKIFFENAKKLWLRNMIISYSIQANLFTYLILDKIHLNRLFRANQFYNYLDICKESFPFGIFITPVYLAVLSRHSHCAGSILWNFSWLSALQESVCILEVKHHKTVFFLYFIFQDVKYKIFF